MPREWPPLTVWWAAGLTAGPPLALWAVLDPNSPPGKTAVGWVAVGCGLTAAGLLHGRGWGWWTAVLGVVGFAGFTVTQAQEVYPLVRARPGMWLLAGPGLAAGAIAATLAALLWWPETRRWCGLLPPADPDTDE
jgi:hypothetical protein